MKKLFTILILLMMHIPVFAASSSGGWTVAKANYSFLSSSQQKIFNKAVQDLDGVSYKPVALLAKQVVAGTNYVFLCQGTTGTKQSWYILNASKSLKNKVTPLSVKKINISRIKTNKNPRKGDTDGGLQIVPVKDKPKALTAAARKAFSTAVRKASRKTAKDHDLIPIALLGTQIVSGTNYRYLCYGATSAFKAIFVLDVYQSTKGNCTVKSCKPMKLEGYAAEPTESSVRVGVSPFPYDAKVVSPDGKDITFYKKPGTWSSAVDGVGKLPCGTVVKVISKYGRSWYHCETSTGIKGYVMAKYLTAGE